MNLSVNKQYGDRLKSDKQVVDLSAKRDYHGIMNKTARFIEEGQLMKKEDWKTFVEQFKIRSDSDNRGWRGEFFGKMMRGASMTYSYTENAELYELLTEIALDMLNTQDEYGRFSTYSRDMEFAGWDMWSRKYVLLGFLHYYEICHDEDLKNRIIEALEKHLDYICLHIGEGLKDISQTSNFWLCINSASILEPTMRMYNITGKKLYLDFADYIVKYLTESRAKIFTLALQNERLPHQYPTVKAYEMMSCFEGLLEYYRATGKEWAKRAAVNFGDLVYNNEITLIGCAGCEHELFNNSVGKQTDTDYVGIMQETCVTVTWMKLCNQLLTLTGNPKYARYVEQSYYNALLGAVNTEWSGEGFAFDSYSPLWLGRRGRAVGGKMIFPGGSSYGCCVAIGAAGTSLPLLTAVTVGKEGIFFNYYENGRISIQDFDFEIDTRYPLDGEITVKILKAPKDATKLSARLPYFGGESTKASLNRSDCGIDSLTDNYFTVTKEWKAGDEIRISVDMNPRIIRPVGCMAIDKTKRFLAVKYGPLVMARDKRVSEVGTPVDLNELTEFNIIEDCPVPCNLHAKVKIGEQILELIDYASSGKTLDENSLTEAWIPTNKS